MNKAEFKEEILKAFFGAKEKDVNKHHCVFGVELPSIAERQRAEGMTKRQVIKRLEELKKL